MRWSKSKLGTLALALALSVSALPAAAQETEPEGAALAAQLEQARALDTSKVADASDMTTVEEVEAGEPVTAALLAEGSYAVDVASSSSMFAIDACTVTVQDGALTADLTLGGTGYLFLYPGSAEEAAAADAEDFIYYEENEAGQRVYRGFPLEALDMPVACAAFSARKEQWYPRTLVFEAAGLPAEARTDAAAQTGADFAPADGTYTVKAKLEGSGKLAAVSPMTLEVEDGVLTGVLVLDSAKVDYVLAGGEKLLPEADAVQAADGQTEFRISVTGTEVGLVVDSTAIAGKHVEKDYTLKLDAATLEPAA